MGDAFGGSVGTMRRAESVVHVEVAQLSQSPGELRIVGFLFRVKAQILQQQGLPALQLLSHLFRLHANAVGRKADVLTAPQYLVDQNAQSLGHRLQAHLGIRLALRTSKVGGQYEPGAVPQRVLDGGQRLADAGVIHDAAVVERDVEVNPHENSFIVQRKITNG